jgi:hypothetical protein
MQDYNEILKLFITLQISYHNTHFQYSHQVSHDSSFKP